MNNRPMSNIESSQPASSLLPQRTALHASARSGSQITELSQFTGMDDLHREYAPQRSVASDVQRRKIASGEDEDDKTYVSQASNPRFSAVERASSIPRQVSDDPNSPAVNLSRLREQERERERTRALLNSNPLVVTSVSETPHHLTRTYEFRRPPAPAPTTTALYSSWPSRPSQPSPVPMLPLQRNQSRPTPIVPSSDPPSFRPPQPPFQASTYRDTQPLQRPSEIYTFGGADQPSFQEVAPVRSRSPLPPARTPAAAMGPPSGIDAPAPHRPPAPPAPFVPNDPPPPAVASPEPQEPTKVSVRRREPVSASQTRVRRGGTCLFNGFAFLLCLICFRVLNCFFGWDLSGRNNANSSNLLLMVFLLVLGALMLRYFDTTLLAAFSALCGYVLRVVITPENNSRFDENPEEVETSTDPDQLTHTLIEHLQAAHQEGVNSSPAPHSSEPEGHPSGGQHSAANAETRPEPVPVSATSSQDRPRAAAEKMGASLNHQTDDQKEKETNSSAEADVEESIGGDPWQPLPLSYPASQANSRPASTHPAIPPASEVQSGMRWGGRQPSNELKDDGLSSAERAYRAHELTSPTAIVMTSSERSPVHDSNGSQRINGVDGAQQSVSTEERRAKMLQAVQQRQHPRQNLQPPQQLPSRQQQPREQIRIEPIDGGLPSGFPTRAQLVESPIVSDTADNTSQLPPIDPSRQSNRIRERLNVAADQSSAPRVGSSPFRVRKYIPPSGGQDTASETVSNSFGPRDGQSPFEEPAETNGRDSHDFDGDGHHPADGEEHFGEPNGHAESDGDEEQQDPELDDHDLGACIDLPIPASSQPRPEWALSDRRESDLHFFDECDSSQLTHLDSQAMQIARYEVKLEYPWEVVIGAYWHFSEFVPPPPKKSSNKKRLSHRPRRDGELTSMSSGSTRRSAPTSVGYDDQDAEHSDNGQSDTEENGNGLSRGGRGDRFEAKQFEDWQHHPALSSLDISYRPVDKWRVTRTGCTYTKREMRAKISIPVLIRKILSPTEDDIRFCVHERAKEDPVNRILRIDGLNESFSAHVFTWEQRIYRVHPDNPRWTLIEQIGIGGATSECGTRRSSIRKFAVHVLESLAQKQMDAFLTFIDQFYVTRAVRDRLGSKLEEEHNE